MGGSGPQQPTAARDRTAAGTRAFVPVGLAALGLSVLGLLVAGYLTYEHFTAATTLACPDTGTVNCAKVTTSEYSRFLGAPVALLGLGFFAAMTVLCTPRLWSTTRRWPVRTRLVAATVGVAFVCYLIWAELFRIDAICLWCTVVHALTLVLFALLAVTEALQPAGEDSSVLPSAED